VVKELEQEATELLMHLGRLWRAASRSWTPATSWRPGRAGERRGGSGNGHQGRTSGGGDALEVEVALASGAGAGGSWGGSPELSGGGSSSRAEQSRAEQLEVDDENLVANTEKPRDSTAKPE
jgi:hypothetical protein